MARYVTVGIRQARDAPVIDKNSSPAYTYISTGDMLSDIASMGSSSKAASGITAKESKTLSATITRSTHPKRVPSKAEDLLFVCKPTGQRTPIEQNRLYVENVTAPAIQLGIRILKSVDFSIKNPFCAFVAIV